MDCVVGVKYCSCTCEACITHARLHEERNLVELARHDANIMEEAGIKVPKGDPSDYCLTSEGKIIFFEIDNFDPSKTADYLGREKHANATRVHQLLNRYTTIVGAR